MTNFDYESIYKDTNHTIVYDNAEGKDSEFYQIIQAEFAASKFPFIQVSLQKIEADMNFFGSKDSREMLLVTANDSPTLNYHIFFNAVVMGNTVMFSQMECMKKGIRSVFSNQTNKEIRATVRREVKSLAEYELFGALDGLSAHIFNKAIKQLKPNV